MSETLLSNIELLDVASTYKEKGFVSPLHVCKADEAKELRRDFEEAEAQLDGDPERLSLLIKYPNQLLPSFYIVKLLSAVIAFTIKTKIVAQPIYNKLYSSVFSKIIYQITQFHQSKSF